MPRIGRPGDGSKRLRLVLQLAFERAVRHLQEQPLDPATGLCRTASRLQADTLRFRDDLIIIDHQINQTGRLCLTGIQYLGEQKEALCARRAIRALRVIVEPVSGLNPILVNADVIRADFPITTRSAAAISETLPPDTCPWIAATTGGRIRFILTTAA